MINRLICRPLLPVDPAPDRTSVSFPFMASWQMKFYRITNASFWGDYGVVLMAGLLVKTEPVPLVSRTGPFVPPIYFLRDLLVVSDEGRELMESSPLSANGYSMVMYSSVVEMHWEKWERGDSLPAAFENVGPEDLVLRGRHSEKIKASMPGSWRVKLARACKSRSEFGPNSWQFFLDSTDWDGSHVFQSVNQQYVFCTEFALDWLTRVFGDWLGYKECANVPLQ